jgi:hypothetical protein
VFTILLSKETYHEDVCDWNSAKRIGQFTEFIEAFDYADSFLYGAWKIIEIEDS